MFGFSQNTIKDELILELNEYNRTKTASDAYALALLIQNLCLTVPGTNPSDPEMGIGIERYLFEFLDKETLDEIRGRIKSQIDKYIPNNNVMEIVVEKLENVFGKENTLGIMFKLEPNFTKTSPREPKNLDEKVILLFNKVKNDSNIISKIVI